MYEPAPPRPKLTNITRTRSGCKECRRRRVKCDEKKPSCGACIRRGRICEAVQPSLKFHNAFQISKNTTATTSVQKQNKSHNHDGNLNKGSRQSHTALLMPKSSLVRSLNRSENELYYLTHWDSSCLEALDCCFRTMTHVHHTDRLLKHSILALSACNLSRSRPERSTDDEPNSDAITYRPDRQHQATSQFYYTSALGQVAKIIKETSPLPTSQDTLLAVLVVFCYIESSMGTFPGFNCHAQGIKKFIQVTTARNGDALASATKTNIGHQLLSAYIHSRCQSWWRRLHFSSFEHQRRRASMSLSDDIVSVLWSIDAKRTLVTSVLCESYRLNLIVSLLQWEDGNTDISEYIAMLENESKKLDDWESRLLPSELPKESPTDPIYPYPAIKPLLFTSHYNAMNYAYYVVARVMQCTETFLQPPGSIRNKTKTTEYWLSILVRIIAGLQKHSCAKMNVYSIGICSLSIACLPRCRGPEIGCWIEAWLLDLLASSVLEEGSFPVAQALAVASWVNGERRDGNEVCAIGLVEDDGGGGGKFDSYSSQYIDRVVLRGWRGHSRWSKEVLWWRDSQ